MSETKRMTVIIVILLILALAFFIISPAARKHPELDKLRGGFIAHRGLHSGSIPENSLAAFRAAAEKGYIIENDIHLTADGEVVVFHDDTLKRMCGVDAKVEEKTLAELKALRLAGTDEQIPTLKECLDEVCGKVPMLIEFKANGNTSALCEAADKILAEYNGEYFVQSFYPQVLAWYKTHRPSIMRGQLAAPFKGDKIERRLLGLMLFNSLSRPDFIAYEHVYGRHIMLRLMKLLGAATLGWTIRSQAELNAAKPHFDGYIFENFEINSRR